MSGYAEVLDALSATEEAIESAVCPTEEFRLESEAAARAKAVAR
jgi:hypothetical protein